MLEQQHRPRDIADCHDSKYEWFLFQERTQPNLPASIYRESFQKKFPYSRVRFFKSLQKLMFSPDDHICLLIRLCLLLTKFLCIMKTSQIKFDPLNATGGFNLTQQFTFITLKLSLLVPFEGLSESIRQLES